MTEMEIVILASPNGIGWQRCRRQVAHFLEIGRLHEPTQSSS